MLPGVYCSAPPLQTWVANNSAPHIRRATALAIFLIHTNSGGILATWLLGFLSPAPKYHKASLTLLIFSIILLVVSIINLFYLKHRNQQKAAEREGQSQRRDSEEHGLGDDSIWYDYKL